MPLRCPWLLDDQHCMGRRSSAPLQLAPKRWFGRSSRWGTRRRWRRPRRGMYGPCCSCAAATCVPPAATVALCLLGLLLLLLLVALHGGTRGRRAWGRPWPWHPLLRPLVHQPLLLHPLQALSQPLLVCLLHCLLTA